jgi:SSS family solute:Na+ symporter
MSSLDSSINAVATLTVVDLIRPRFIKGREDAFYLKAAKLVAILTSAIMILLAWIFSTLPKESMADLGWIVVSVFGGCLVGLFMLGFFSTRVDNQCVLVALPISILLNFYLMLNTVGWLPQGWSIDIHSYWVGILVNIVFVCLAYGISLILSKPPGQRLEGLTIWTQENTRHIKTAGAETFK